MSKTVVIVGASRDRKKFGNKAVRAYLKRGWRVVPVNPKDAEVEGVAAVAALDEVEGPVDRVAIYVPPAVGVTLLPAIAQLQPGDFLVNPGAESPELMEEARRLGLRPLERCAIRDIGESPDAYGE